jgi:hypothetical protein
VLSFVGSPSGQSLQFSQHYLQPILNVLWAFGVQVHRPFQGFDAIAKREHLAFDADSTRKLTDDCGSLVSSN